jgi:hypothetical protein
MPRKLQVEHFLAASGGGLRGLIHSEIAKTLDEDARAGESIGGMRVASRMSGIGAKLDTRLEQLSSHRDIFRLKFDVGQGFWKDGLFDPEPWERMMEADGLGKHDDGVPTWVGMCDVGSNTYEQVRLNGLSPRECQGASLSTGIQSPVMEIRKFRGRVKVDAGFYKHVIPPVPDQIDLSKLKRITVLACSPVFAEQRKVNRRQEDIDSAAGLLSAMFDDIITRTILHDMDMLRAYAAMGIEVMIYAPDTFSQVGATFDTSREVRDIRLETAQMLVKRGGVRL